MRRVKYKPEDRAANVHGGNEAARQEWATPDDVFEEISKLYGPFDLDVAASPKNTKCLTWISEKHDALRTDWKSNCAWCNPPYKDPGAWIRRAEDQLRKGNCRRVVMLLPNSTETEWFGNVVRNARWIDFLSGRFSTRFFASVRSDRLWTIHFWPRRIRFVPPPGVKASRNPKGSVVLVGEGSREGW